MKPLAGRRVFVTGHTGFKGAWTIALLRALGAELTGYSLPPPTTPSLFDEAALSSKLARHHIGDVRALEQLRDAIAGAAPECVLHLAAQSLVLEGLSDPQGTFATNVLGTVNVLEAIREVPSVRAVLIVTSDKCYEPAARALRESDPLGGHDPYSASKACAEIVVAGYRAASGVGALVASARAGNVIGGGDWAQHRLFADLARAMQADQTLVLRHPDAVRPWQHVLDALAGYVTILERLLDGDASVARAWNFGPAGAGHVSVREAVDLFARSYGRELTVTVEPAAAPENPTLVLDSTAARQHLGWKPAFDMPAAVDETAAFYRRRAAGESPATLLAEGVERFLGAAKPQ